MTDNETKLLVALRRAASLIEMAASWIDLDDTTKFGPAENAAHTRLLEGLDAGLVDFHKMIAEIQ